MISNLRISVAELVVWALLATAGLTWISLRALDGAVWLMDWLRDRVTPLLKDDDLCPCGKPIDHTEFCYDAPPPLPPERTWEQMTSHQLPLADQRKLTPAQEEAWQPWVAERERRAPAWEVDHRAHYVAMGLEYPSGLMARVREAAQ